MREGRRKGSLQDRLWAACSRKPLYDHFGQMGFNFTGDFLRNAPRIVPPIPIPCLMRIASGVVNSTAHPDYHDHRLYRMRLQTKKRAKFRLTKAFILEVRFEYWAWNIAPTEIHERLRYMILCQVEGREFELDPEENEVLWRLIWA